MKKGFTLIELLVVIAIISLLAAIVLVSLGSGRVKGRNGGRTAQVEEIEKAFELYKANTINYTYPKVDRLACSRHCITNECLYYSEVIPRTESLMGPSGFLRPYISEIKADKIVEIGSDSRNKFQGVTYECVAKSGEECVGAVIGWAMEQRSSCTNRGTVTITDSVNIYCELGIGKEYDGSCGSFNGVLDPNDNFGNVDNLGGGDFIDGNLDNLGGVRDGLNGVGGTNGNLPLNGDNLNDGGGNINIPLDGGGNLDDINNVSGGTIIR